MTVARRLRKRRDMSYRAIWRVCRVRDPCRSRAPSRPCSQLPEAIAQRGASSPIQGHLS